MEGTELAKGPAAELSSGPVDNVRYKELGSAAGGFARGKGAEKDCGGFSVGESTSSSERAEMSGRAGRELGAETTPA